MKRSCLIIGLLFSSILRAQTITLIAGGGTGLDGSPATVASIFSPQVMAFDRHGNIYFTESLGHRIRKINTFGIITTIAGTGSSGFSGDSGPATAATMNQPIGIATDNHSNVYFSDNGNHRIRRIDAVTNIITTIAGTGAAGYNGDGIPASVAQLNYPQGINIDNAGNIYISDNANFRLRKINTSGIISTIAGNGSSVSSGDGGVATAAACGPWNVGFDGDGNIYMSDGASYTVRKINTTGIISTVVGKSGMYVYNGDGIPATNANIAPACITVDANGIIYIPDGYNDRIRRVNTVGIIETVAGDGTPGYSGDGGLAKDSKTNGPSCVVLDSCGNLFFAQMDNPRIRKIAFNPTCAPTSIVEAGKEDTGISIHPNPATTALTISSGKAISSIAITNMLGQSVCRHTITKGEKKTEVIISHLPPGMYVVRVNDKWVQRFMKE